MDITVNLKDKTRDLYYSYNKDFYWSIINTKIRPAAQAETAWRNQFGIEITELSKYYKLPFESIRQTKIQCMQYKIINNIYACILKLYHWKIKNSSQCKYCDQVDNVLHHFYYCNDIKLFWNSFHNWWSQTCKKCIYVQALTAKQVVLGITEKVCHKPQLNYIILLAKWYIFRSKYLGEACFFIEYLSELKNNLESERVIYNKNNKHILFIEMWQEIYNNL